MAKKHHADMAKWADNVGPEFNGDGTPAAADSPTEVYAEHLQRYQPYGLFAIW